jgi:hypothetical protein
MNIEGATLELTRAELDELVSSGFVKIDDPERGEIEVRLTAKPDPGGGDFSPDGQQRRSIKGQQMKVKVIRAGVAARVRRA